MEEISTSFCFICLLHLANEQGLKLESSADRQEADESELVDGEKKIGNIWDVKVRAGIIYLRSYLIYSHRYIATPMLLRPHDFYSDTSLFYGLSLRRSCFFFSPNLSVSYQLLCNVV